MIKVLFGFLTILICINAHAASVFTWSGASIAAIFNSKQVWTKVSGHVDTIVYKGFSENTETYSLTTAESVGIKNENGVVIGHKKVPCTILVDVTATGDEMAPTLEVTKVNFDACPVAESK